MHSKTKNVSLKQKLMKKFLTLFSALLVTGSLLAGGLVTNTNHSAYMVRMLSRQASTGVDAVYYNPAGLTSLADGFHFSLNNQIIGQTKTITNNYYFLTEKPTEYIGTVSAPVFPGVYAVYKTGKFAFSAGFNPVGGGGGAEYATGLPSFEKQIANLVPGLQAQLTPLDQGVIDATTMDPDFNNVTGYDGAIFFEGSSIYFGYQANVSYEINDFISVALGGRYVTAKNTYQGYVKDVTITASPAALPGSVPAPYNGTPGNYLRAIAQTPYGASQATSLNTSAAYLDAATNIEADVVEEGSGFTPIVSVNITPSEMLNISLKYEFKTKLDLTTTVNDGKDGGGMFEDGGTKVADMPAVLSAGVGVRPIGKLYLAAGINYYFDKNNDYDGSRDLEVEMIDKNFYEYSVGVEYALTNMIKLSAGYSGTSTGVNDNYQSDLRYSLNTSTFGGGIGLTLSPMIDINLGGMWTMYQDGSKSTAVTGLPDTIETYDTETWVIGIGVDLHF
jgi:long-subunit fatty acid transport protein